MDREWLRERLEAGRSIESVAREAERHPSTVAYWAQRHGLASVHAPRHAARGGVAREQLLPLLAEGLTTRQLAERLSVSQTTVRHWLKRYGLETAGARRVSPRPLADGAAVGTCKRHGETAFARRRDGGWRCLACRSEAVTQRRRRVKAILVAEAGGACTACGYDRHPAALQFHHIDPSEKRFALSDLGLARSLEKARAEAAKCVLLCANCHALVEAGEAANLVPRPPAAPG